MNDRLQACNSTRNLWTSTNINLPNIRNLIAKGQLGQAADLLILSCQPLHHDYHDEAILLSQRFYGLEDENRIRGTVSILDVCRERNNIASGMLQLIRKLDRLQQEKFNS